MSPIGVALRAAFALAVVQIALSWTTVAEPLGISRVSLVLLPTVVGYLLPFSLGLSVFALLLARVSERRALFLRRPEFVGPTIATVFVLPYGWYLATFTFSGPSIRDVALQPLLVVVLFLVLVGSAFLAALVLTQRQRAKVRSFFWASSFTVLVLAAAIVNLAVLPNEYEPLHRFVSLVALIAAVGLGHELRPPRLTSRIGWAGPMLSAAVVLTLVALAPATLQKSYAVSWFVEGENALSRYLPSLQPHREVEQIVSDDGSAPIGKVTIGTPAQEAALREVRAGRKLPHLVVFSIDNVQADRVGAYGYRGNPSTPNIDRIARRGAVFREAYTLYPGTRVFLSSMLTGRRLPPFSVHKMPTDYQLRSLTRLLDEHGYHVLVKGVFELTASRRFNPDDYGIDTNLRRATLKEIRKRGTMPHIPYEERFKHIEEHLKTAGAKNEPVFVWLHWLQPHRFRGKFVPTEGFDFGESLDGLYDSAIAGTDALIPRLESMMGEHLSPDRDVIWVIMSDHGTGMTRGSKSERGKTLYQDQVHVPLIIAGPGMSPQTINGPIDAAVDTASTLLDLVGIEPPATYDGVSLVPLLHGRASGASLEDRFITLQSGSWLGAVHRHHKLIVRKGSVSLFDLEADPLEKKNIADRHPDMVEDMRRRMKTEQKRMKQSYKEGLASRDH